MSIEAITVESEDETVRVELDHWLEAAVVGKDQGFSYFCFLSAMDWLPNPDLDGEKVFAAGRDPAPPQEVIVDPVIRKAGGTSRFQLLARLYDIDRHVGLTLTTDLDDSLTAASWTSVFAGADWHERETWEMFGITFIGHPGLRHLYLPDGFEGHPLRKDYPLLAREVRPWPGLVDMEEMPKAPEEPAE